MKIETFNKAAVLISTAFPERKFEPEVYFELLKDLKDGPFLMAVIDVCKTQKELYPGTNLIAILRERTSDINRTQNQTIVKMLRLSEKHDPNLSLLKMFDEEVAKFAEEKRV